MTDRFHDLYEPIRPVDPDPEFARRLRARLERALSPNRKVFPMTETQAQTQVQAQNQSPPGDPDVPVPAAVPYLAVTGARDAISWYERIFGARLAEAPIEMDDGRIGHADLIIGGGHVYISDAYPEIGVAAPRPGEASVSLMLPVDDADDVRARAVEAGASGDRPPYDGYGRRNAWIVDPFGHRWGLNSPLRA